MKTRNLFFCLFLFFSLNASAQDWTVGTKWIYYQYDAIYDGIDEYWMFEGLADTTIASLDYLIIESSFLSQKPSGLEILPMDKFYMRKDGNQVWVFEPTTSETLLLYDFDAAQGDTLEIYAFSSSTPNQTILLDISSTGSETIDGVVWDNQEVLTIDHNCQYGMEGKVVKGVGSLSYLLPVYICADPNPGGYLICFDNGTEKYPSADTNCDHLVLPTRELLVENAALAFPNPTADFLNLKQPNFDKWELWSSDGKKMMVGNEATINMQSLADGIYLLVVYDREGRAAFQKISKVD